MTSLAMIGIVRVCVVLVAADLYDLSLHRSRPLPYEPSVWVVIPAYNEELCVARAVRSVLDSSYPDVSVIVVDDGSTDGTVACLHGFGSRVRVVSQPNSGKAAAINTGMRLVGDGLVMVLDAGHDRACPMLAGVRGEGLTPEASKRRDRHSVTVAAGRAETQNACGDQVRPSSWAQVDEAGSHRGAA